MINELILEIGTEEIPALFLEDSTVKFREEIIREFAEKSLEYKNMETYYTPRRITLKIDGLLPDQKDRVVDTFGPPKHISFDKDGNPTKAASGFAKAQGVNVKDLEVISRDKGEFLAVRKKIKGIKTEKVLGEILPGLIVSIPFKKSMRWGSDKITFARPIRWIMCIYNSRVINFRIENVESSSKTYGHRFVKNNVFEPADWNDYISGLKKRYVMLDQTERKKLILHNANKIAKELNGYIEIGDRELVETVTNLVEYPFVMSGNFEEKFLNLPDEVLTSVMKNHQKYFPVIDSGTGKLAPSFIFVCGSPVKDSSIVIKGNERVLRARLNDAEFFYIEDTKEPLVKKLDELKDMVFLSEIGTYYEKVERIEKISGRISELCGEDNNFISDITRSAKLCKIDLVSQMVFEFPELQGIMGKYYASMSKEKKKVAVAIEEHYMPTGRDSSLPKSRIGALLSIADKMDNISCCFAAGLKPTGSADPYALRRQAIGIIQISLDKKLDFNVEDLVRFSLDNINISFNKKESQNDIIIFLSERFRNLYIDSGFPGNVIDSVISTGFSNIVDISNRIKAVDSFRKQKDFEELAVAFKRVVNIAKSRPDKMVKQDLFQNKAEQELYNSFLNIKKKTSEYLRPDSGLPEKKDYLKSLAIIRTLKVPVDKFFDSVMVMDKNEELRNNRMALLADIKDLFFLISDFSKI